MYRISRTLNFMLESWCPLFSKIVDSSIWREDDLVVKVFLTLLAKKGPDHIVRASAFTIGEWAKKTEAEALKALKVLASPDTKRLEKQPFDGRRIEKVEGGWLILNGQTYEEEMRRISRRAYKAKKEREYRNKKRGKPLTGESEYVQASDAGATQDELNRIVEKHLPQAQD